MAAWSDTCEQLLSLIYGYKLIDSVLCSDLYRVLVTYSLHVGALCRQQRDAGICNAVVESAHAQVEALELRTGCSCFLDGGIGDLIHIAEVE